MSDLNILIANAPFDLIAVAIDKRREPIDGNPYRAALGVGLVQLTRYLRENSERRLTHVVFESRGKNEDAELADAFEALCEPNGALDGCNLELVFASKQHSHCGLQLADLIARPIGRNIINPRQPNRAYEIVLRKFWRAPEHLGWGLHVLPSPEPGGGTDGGA